jgi:hypothetical protein
MVEQAAHEIGQEIVQELLRMMEPLAAEMRTKRERGVPLDDANLTALRDAFVTKMRSRGWLQEVDPERLVDIVEVVVITDDNGDPELDVESNVTGSVWSVPGWGVTETDPVEIGQGLADDEADLLDDARESGELTGWE